MKKSEIRYKEFKVLLLFGWEAGTRENFLLQTSRSPQMEMAGTKSKTLLPKSSLGCPQAGHPALN
jgi:hypothetical protein